MKKNSLFVVGCLTLLFLSCEKKDNNEPLDSSDTTHQQVYQPPNPGNVIFFNRSLGGSYGRGVDVWINWINSQHTGIYLGKITNMPLDIPYCGSWWGKNFSDTIFGQYTYHAKVDEYFGHTWDGSFNLVSDTCIKIPLSY